MIRFYREFSRPLGYRWYFKVEANDIDESLAQKLRQTQNLHSYIKEVRFEIHADGAEAKGFLQEGCVAIYFPAMRCSFYVKDSKLTETLQRLAQEYAEYVDSGETFVHDAR